MSQIKQISFYFEKEPNFEVEIVLEDSMKSLNRANKFMKMANSGSRIELSLGGYIYSYYVAEFEQNVFVKDEAIEDCENYPTKEFHSFGQCDADWVERVFENDFPADFMPVWATDDHEKVTTSFLEI